MPTQRAARELGRALVKASGGGSLILPRIAPLGAFEAEQDGLLFEAPADALFEAPDAVSELTRRMVLARMIQAWGQALRGAIARIDSDGQLLFHAGEAPLVAGSPAQAFALAGDLGALIDDMIIEGVPWSRLEDSRPMISTPIGASRSIFSRSPSRNGRPISRRPASSIRPRAAPCWWRRKSARLKAGTRTALPIIIAGSTGTNRATADLIAAIARAPQGAVVLPDLDQSAGCEAASWRMIGARGLEEFIAGHPQAALFRLLGDIIEEQNAGGRAPSSGHAVAPPLRTRARYLSEALRPADSTDFWQRRGEALSDARASMKRWPIRRDHRSGRRNRSEALALAIAMRAALEIPGKTAALVSSDTQIATRVQGGAGAMGRRGRRIRPAKSSARPPPALSRGSR